MLYFERPSQITTSVASLTEGMTNYLQSLIPQDSILKGGEEFEDDAVVIRNIADQDLEMEIVDFVSKRWYYSAHRRYRIPTDKSINIVKYDKQDVTVENTGESPIQVYIITRVANKRKNVLPPITVYPGQSVLF
jgi:hypothetical protein